MAENSGILTNLKDFFNVLREGIITIVLLLFLILPGVMKNVLARAGITSADLGGFKWELQQSAQQTQAATETVASLETSLVGVKQQLDQINQVATTPEVKQQITNLSQEVSKTQAETSNVRTTLDTSLATQRSVIQRVDPSLLQQMQIKK